MKTILAILLFSFRATSWVQFTPNSGDYTFQINERAKYQRKEIDDGYMEIYTIVGENTSSAADYIITVSKLNSFKEEDGGGISSPVFKANYLATCSCEVTSEREEQYKNFKAIVYNVRMKKKNGYMAGESVNIVHNGVLYNVSYYTAESLVPKFKAEFDYTMNSMKIFK